MLVQSNLVHSRFFQRTSREKSEKELIKIISLIRYCYRIGAATSPDWKSPFFGFGQSYMAIYMEEHIFIWRYNPQKRIINVYTP